MSDPRLLPPGTRLKALAIAAALIAFGYALLVIVCQIATWMWPS